MAGECFWKADVTAECPVSPEWIVDPERQDGSEKREEYGQGPLLGSSVTPTWAVLGVPCVRRHPPEFRAHVVWDPPLTCQRFGNESAYRGTAVGGRSRRVESWQCWRSMAVTPFLQEWHFSKQNVGGRFLQGKNQ